MCICCRTQRDSSQVITTNTMIQRRTRSLADVYALFSRPGYHLPVILSDGC